MSNHYTVYRREPLPGQPKNVDLIYFIELETMEGTMQKGFI